MFRAHLGRVFEVTCHVCRLPCCDAGAAEKHSTRARHRLNLKFLFISQLARAQDSPPRVTKPCTLGAKARRNLQNRLRRLRHDPTSATYHAKYEEALRANINPTRAWHFPEPVSAADVTSPPSPSTTMEMKPDDEPNVDLAMEVRRERKRLQAKKDRAAKKQREEEKTAEATRTVLEDATSAQNRMARRDVTKLREAFGDDEGRWIRFCYQVFMSPEMREAVLARAREIDPARRRVFIRRVD